jgi:hypothetical protein
MPNFGVDRGTDSGNSGAPATWDADLVDYSPPGGGNEESVQEALARIVHRGQYDTDGEYEAARDAISDTAGLNNLDVTGDAEVQGSLEVNGNITIDGVNLRTSLQAFAVAMGLALG